MIIENQISQYIVLAEDSILKALQKIVNHKGRVIFSVTEFGVLEGLLTNGDILRWLASEQPVDLKQSVSRISNKDFLFVTSQDKSEKIYAYLDEVLYVPIVDDRGHILAVARKRKPGEGIKIGHFTINAQSPTFVIAEIGINHNGSLDLAKRLIDEAVRVGADCAKFQMRNMQALYRNEGNSNDVRENLGSQYTLDLLSRFQLSTSEMFTAFDYCKQVGILPLCTPWDLKSLEALEKYGMLAYKVASADLTNFDLLNALAKTRKPLICSTGMSTEREIIEAVTLLRQQGARYVLLHCNSTYPAPFKDINLNYLDRLKEIGDCPVGYSGHERGIHVAVAAVARGAKVIEKHFTLDRSMEGNDHKVSLLPEEFKLMTEAIRQVEQALGNYSERRLSQGEMMNRVTLAKSLFINCDLEPGEIIKGEMIEVKSPGRGLQPNRKAKLIGKRATRPFKAGDFFYPSDLAQKTVQARKYSFKRSWGVPVRYYDFKAFLAKSNPDLLEFHLSYNDLEHDIHKYFDQPYDLDLVVHSPELFSGDHILNLCSPSEDYRKHSIRELQRVIDLTRSLKHFFNKSSRTLIVTNVGGVTINSPLHPSERSDLYRLLLKSLAELDTAGVEIIPQTMPPFPWYFGGQRYSNLFVEPQEIAEFCRQHGYRVCLDISHSKLACNQHRWSFEHFIEQVGPYTAHIHLADAEGIDGEGLQIGEGGIDFPALAADLDKVATLASFIPEIWQGHENDGEGFWIALERLEKWF